MKILNLHLNNFRNYRETSISFSKSINIFIGDNAQGKTNILEAIHILATTKSFRSVKYENMLKHDENSFRIECEILKNDVFKKVKINYDLKNKLFFINDKKINKISDILGIINVSILCPEDIQIIKGDSHYRRRFIDIALCQLDKVYLINLIEYQKVLRNKNAVLKYIRIGRAKERELEPWNTQIIDISREIYSRRRDFLIDLNEKNKKTSFFLSGETENIEIKYIDDVLKGQTSDVEEYIKELKIKQKRVWGEEIKRGISLFGPHRDELKIEINGKNIKHIGSQGQQRTVAISLRLAEVECMYARSGEYPILLIDDIFSELDNKRKAYFMELLNRNTQMFLTGTRVDEFPTIFNQAATFKINQGSIDDYGK